MNKNNNFSDLLRHENELTKLKMQAEFGMHFGGGEKELNPAIESIWLNQIIEYERSMGDSKKIKIAELLGNPEFRNVDELSDDEVLTELQKLMELMHSKNIVVDAQYEITNREMYRFITQELFQTETNSHFPNNMILGFIYEEFHPNDEGDIRRYSDEFINALAEKSNDYFETFLHRDDEDEIKDVLVDNLIRKLSLFRDAFENIRMEEFTIEGISVLEKSAEVKFDFKFAVLPCESKTYHRISGEGKFSFACKYEFWRIDGIEMKGVV